MVYQPDLSDNDDDWVHSGCGSSVMDRIKMRVNFLLSDTNVKVDFLRGRPRCRHPHHAMNPKALDLGEMERGIHVKRITDKLVKVKSEIDFTVDAARIGGNSSQRATNAKLRLLRELELYDHDLHDKLEREVRATEVRNRITRDGFYVLGGEERSVDGKIGTGNERLNALTKASLNAPASNLVTLKNLEPEEYLSKAEKSNPSEEPPKLRTWAFFNQF